MDARTLAGGCGSRTLPAARTVGGPRPVRACTRRALAGSGSVSVLAPRDLLTSLLDHEPVGLRSCPRGHAERLSGCAGLLVKKSLPWVRRARSSAMSFRAWSA